MICGQYNYLVIFLILVLRFVLRGNVSANEMRCVVKDTVRSSLRLIASFTRTSHMCVGVHVVLMSGNQLTYVVHNLSLGKADHVCHFSQDAASLLGTRSNPISLTTNVEVKIA